MGDEILALRQDGFKLGVAAQEGPLYPFALSAAQQQVIMDSLLARQRLVARRLTDTGHPDGKPFDIMPVDLLADPG